MRTCVVARYVRHVDVFHWLTACNMQGGMQEGPHGPSQQGMLGYMKAVL